jgi:hypothetical protein
MERNYGRGKITGTGKVTGVTTTTEPECPVIVNGNKVNCFVSSVTSGGLPWHVTIGAETAITIAGANFKNVYTGGGCGAIGIPTGLGISASGDITGKFVNVFNDGCIDFIKAGDMKGPGGIAVLLDLQLCAEDLTLG